ncbi:MAG: hypothetical protein H6842_13855 [Rhodospirillaceae bacterium]|nr:hypothetical protein [Rhodospirillaceae bacterium]
MRRTLICLVSLLAAAAPAWADHRPGHPTPPGHLNRGNGVGVITVPSEPSVSVQIGSFRFSLDDRNSALAYYHNHPGDFGTLSALPPGIAQQVARGRGLPPGIARRYAPAGLINVLSPVPDGFSLVIAGDRLVALNIATDVIEDVVDLFGN